VKPLLSSGGRLLEPHRNRNRAAVSSWLGWCATKAKWTAPAVPATCERRKEPDDQTKAVDPAVIDRICTHRDIPLRERVLWRMLYESASRAAAVLALNVEDCDLDNRRAKVTVKGGDIGWVIWGQGTARLLPRYLKGREAGPLFCSDRRPGPARRAATPSRDICPETGRMRLGYDRARTLIKKHTGLNLHTLRHSAATHLGEAGADATVDHGQDPPPVNPHPSPLHQARPRRRHQGHRTARPAPTKPLTDNKAAAASVLVRTQNVAHTPRCTGTPREWDKPWEAALSWGSVLCGRSPKRRC
jgi:integrase